MQSFNKPHSTYTAPCNVLVTECSSTPELFSLLERVESLKDTLQKNLHSIELSLDRISPTQQKCGTPEGERSVNSFIDKLRCLTTDIELIDSRVQEISFRLNKLV